MHKRGHPIDPNTYSTIIIYNHILTKLEGAFISSRLLHLPPYNAKVEEQVEWANEKTPKTSVAR